MHRTYATPLVTDLYDLALEKACGYVNGSSDIGGKINTGIDNEIYYDSGAPHQHNLYLFNAGIGECCCHAIVMRLLMRSIGIDASVVYIWGGCSDDTVDFYRYRTWWGPSFRIIKLAHDEAGENPHFTYHAQTLVAGTYYDPSYGTTGLVELDETAPACHPYYEPSYHDHHSIAATRRTGGSYPPNYLDVDWRCPH